MKEGIKAENITLTSKQVEDFEPFATPGIHRRVDLDAALTGKMCLHSVKRCISKALWAGWCSRTADGRYEFNSDSEARERFRSRARWSPGNSAPASFSQLGSLRKAERKSLRLFMALSQEEQDECVGMYLKETL